MATTGQSTTSMKRTTVLNNRFSHLVFLFGVLLITLLTSGKAMADNYTITLSGNNLTITPATIAGGIGESRELTLTVASGAYKLPVSIDGIAIASGESLTQDGEEANGFTYNNQTGVITLNNEVNITGIVTITAEAVAKSSNATLSALTYANDNISGGAPQNVPDFSSAEIPDITLDYNSSLENSTITMSGTCTDGNASAPNATATISSGEATVTVTVTAEDGQTTKEYVVNFKVANDKLASITVPTVTLSERVTTAEEALEILNASPNNQFTLVTVGGQNITVEGTWSYEGSFDNKGGANNDFTWTIDRIKLAEKKLDENNVDLSAKATITNVVASTDATLKTLTYTVNEEGSVTVTGFDARDAETHKNYTVELPSSTPKGAIITVVAETNDEMAEIEKKELTATLDTKGEATITFTITPESGDAAKRTITIDFRRSTSHIITLSSLKYKIGDGEEKTVDGFKPEDDKGIGYNVTLPFGTPANAVITIIAIPTDENETITPDNRTITLSDGYGRMTLHVNAEDGISGQNITIVFTTGKEKITSITVPTTPVLEAEKTEEEVKAIVDAIDKVAVTSEGGTLTELPITWALDDEFDATPGKKNSYTWTITAGSYDAYEIDGQTTTGKIEVTNFIPAVTGEKDDVTIDASNPVDKIGDGGTTSTTIENDVTISSGATIDQLTIDNVTVEGQLVIGETVNEIVLKDATIPAVTLATGKTTTLSLQSGNAIGKITNAGTLTLQNAEPAVQALSLAIETRTAAPTNGAVSEVVNNGVFTDNTATIVAVTGDADLTITSLPKGQTTEGKEVTLTVAAESTSGNVTYQWQEYSGSWENVSSKEASLTITKVGDGTTKYRCEVKSTNKDNGAKTTTLYTPAASVTFRTASTGGDDTPSIPSTKTYTVKLAKVTGATFSKGESTTVDEGSSFSFSITLDKDYDQSKPVVTVDGKAIEANADGSYTIKNIQKDTEIIVTGIVKNTATGTEDAIVDATRVWSNGSTLYIHTAKAATAYIFNGNGALQRELCVSGDQNLQLHAGFYIVRIDDYSAKVIIR